MDKGAFTQNVSQHSKNLKREDLQRSGETILERVRLLSGSTWNVNADLVRLGLRRIEEMDKGVSTQNVPPHSKDL